MTAEVAGTGEPDGLAKERNRRAQIIDMVASSRYIPIDPTPKQLAFLCAPEMEVLVGGAAGGGKSVALLMALLLFADEPGYFGIFFRRSYQELEDSILLTAKDWLNGSGARFNSQQHVWTFPGGGRIRFSHLQRTADIEEHRSAEYQLCCFDELTTFSEQQYRFLFSRLRRRRGIEVPLRMLSGTNPGGPGHNWVRDRFRPFERVDIGAGRRFIPSLLRDNPHLDPVEYERSLAELDPITRARLLDGDWSVLARGGWFDRANYEVVDAAPPGLRLARGWDFAATEAKNGNDPDWTVGALLGAAQDGTCYILDVQRWREGPAETEARVRAIVSIDGHDVEQHFEREPGSSGKVVEDHYLRTVIPGYAARFWPATGDKSMRAKPLSAAVMNGRVRLVRGLWNMAYLDEAEPFPTPGIHDDQVDASSLAYSRLYDQLDWHQEAPMIAVSGRAY